MASNPFDEDVRSHRTEIEQLKAERDALLAHILSLTDRLDRETISDSFAEIQAWHSRTPEASLARLKAQWQAEALEGMPLKGCFDLPDAINLRDACVRVYRRQAEGE